jgi:hypothetical protein
LGARYTRRIHSSPKVVSQQPPSNPHPQSAVTQRQPHLPNCNPAAGGKAPHLRHSANHLHPSSQHERNWSSAGCYLNMWHHPARRTPTPSSLVRLPCAGPALNARSTGREGEHAPGKPSLRCAAQALLRWGRRRAWQAEATVSREAKACAGAGGVARTRAAFWKESREVTSSCDRRECRNASVHARSARRSRRHELARAASRSKKLCGLEQLERFVSGHRDMGRPRRSPQ